MRVPPAESLERVSEELYEKRSSFGVTGTIGEGEAHPTCVSEVGVGELTVGVPAESVVLIPRDCVSMPRTGDASGSFSFFDFSFILNMPLMFRKDEECGIVLGDRRTASLAGVMVE